MRSRLVLLVGATSSLILVAFLVPLAVLLRTTTADRVIAQATVRAQSLAPALATPDGEELPKAIARENQVRTTTVFLPDRRMLGAPVARSGAVALGLAGTSTPSSATCSATPRRGCPSRWCSCRSTPAPAACS